MYMCSGSLSNQTVGFSKKVSCLEHLYFPYYNLSVSHRTKPQLMNNRSLLREKIFLQNKKRKRSCQLRNISCHNKYSEISVSYHSRVQSGSLLSTQLSSRDGPETLASLLCYRAISPSYPCSGNRKKTWKEAHPLIESYGLERYTSFLPSFH